MAGLGDAPKAALLSLVELDAPDVGGWLAARTTCFGLLGGRGLLGVVAGGGVALGVVAGGAVLLVGVELLTALAVVGLLKVGGAVVGAVVGVVGVGLAVGVATAVRVAGLAVVIGVVGGLLGALALGVGRLELTLFTALTD
jgi:hypothetical protein